MPYDISRFLHAQDTETFGTGYDDALDEIMNGQKKTHWIWYIFPQLKGLGETDTSNYFGIENIDEACEYLQNEELLKRYDEIVAAVQEKLTKGKLIKDLMDGDEKKLISSLTLFRSAAALLADKEKDGQIKQKYRILETRCNTIFDIFSKEYPVCQFTEGKIPPYKKSPEEKIEKPVSKREPKQKREIAGAAPSPEYLAAQEKVRCILDDYIALRSSERDYFFQGIFKGYKKKDKLRAAIHLRLLVCGDIQKDSVIDKVIKKYHFSEQELRRGRLEIKKNLFGQESEPRRVGIEEHIKVLEQGRLGDKLREVVLNTPAICQMKLQDENASLIVKLISYFYQQQNQLEKSAIRANLKIGS